MENLWPDFENYEIEKNDSLKIIKEQARAIKSATKGIISATCSKMNYVAGPTNALAEFGRAVSAMSSPVFEEVLEEELLDKDDANDFYKITKYKFEIYNADYRFRLFVLNYRELFPISLEIDEGILEDVSYTNNSSILSNDELKRVLKDIFSSNKVRLIVSKMLQIG